MRLLPGADDRGRSGGVPGPAQWHGSGGVDALAAARADQVRGAVPRRRHQGAPGWVHDHEVPGGEDGRDFD